MRILLALDHSENSNAAFDYLGSLRFTQPVDLQIITVIAPVPMVAFGIPPVIGPAIEDEKEFIRRKLASIAPGLKEHFRSVSFEVRVGVPSLEIRRAADDLGADLIVLGAVGHSALVRMLLGSVSDHVATHAHTSTLVVRPALAPTTGLHPRRILLAVGHSTLDQNLVRCLHQLQLPATAEIHLVHVVETASSQRQELLPWAPRLQEDLKSSAQGHLLTMQQSLNEMGLKTHVHLLEDAHVGETLVTFAEQHHCDLVLTSDHRHGVLDRMLLGSTSRFILRHASSSVLIARDAAPQAEGSD